MCFVSHNVASSDVNQTQQKLTGKSEDESESLRGFLINEKKTVISTKNFSAFFLDE